MTFSEAPEFGHEDRRRVYEYVGSHGEVDADEVREALGLDRGGFRHHVAILKRDGYLVDRDGTLGPAFEAGTTEEYAVDGIEFGIRPARQSDLSGVVGAIRQVAERGRYIVAESVADEIDHQDALLRHDEIESRVFFVATVADGTQSDAPGTNGVDPGADVVGWVHLHAPELDKLAHTAELTVGVIDEYRGYGIGSHLLERGLEWAAANGYEKVYNSVPSVNEDAVAFLESHGWEIEAVREDHYRIDGEYVDEVMMAVDL